MLVAVLLEVNIAANMYRESLRMLVAVLLEVNIAANMYSRYVC